MPRGWLRLPASLVAMNDDEILAEAVRRIRQQFSPLQIILFGSRARGDAGTDSDFDLMVLLPTCSDVRGTVADIRLALRRLPAAFDIVVQTTADWDRWRAVPMALQHTISDEGRVLYG